jgi:hypothetical protein
VPAASRGKLRVYWRGEQVLAGPRLEELAVAFTIEPSHKTSCLRVTNPTRWTVDHHFSWCSKQGPAAVQGGTLRRLWTFNLQLTERRVRLSFQFVLVHRAIPRNEAVDKLAKSAMSSAVTSRA